MATFRVPLRFSEPMINRLTSACDQEGIDRSSLVVSYMYQIIKQVKSGQVPEFDLSYYLLDHNREKVIDIRVSETLKKNFEKTLELLNKERTEKLTTSNVLISYLIKFVVESEQNN